MQVFKFLVQSTFFVGKRSAMRIGNLQERATYKFQSKRNFCFRVCLILNREQVQCLDEIRCFKTCTKILWICKIKVNRPNKLTLVPSFNLKSSWKRRCTLHKAPKKYLINVYDFREFLLDKTPSMFLITMLLPAAKPNHSVAPRHGALFVLLPQNYQVIIPNLFKFYQKTVTNLLKNFSLLTIYFSNTSIFLYRSNYSTSYVALK